MQIAEITRNKKKAVNEVNWGAIGGALAGMAKQSVTGQTTQAVPGQEATVSQQMLQPLQNQQIQAATQAWKSAVAAKMQQQKTTDPNQLGTYQLTSMITDYIDNRLFAGRAQVKSLPARFKQAIIQDIRGIVLATKVNNESAMTQQIENLVKNVQTATTNQVFRQPTGTSQTQLTPAAQVMMQRMAPQIAQLQKSWPQGQNQQVMPTNNQAVNALLAGLGLLRTSGSPVIPGAPAQTPPPTPPGNTP